MTPYYQDEASRTCQCGCGKPVRPGRRFVNGHNARRQPKSSEHRIGIEIEERYCEIAAQRLSQGVLDLGGVA